MGVVSPLGSTVDSMWENAKNGVCGIDNITKFDATDFKVKVAGEGRDFDAEEYMTKKATKEFNYPVIVNPCPANGSTKRQDVKELLAQLNSTMPGVKKNIFGALNNSEKLFIWDKDKIK